MRIARKITRASNAIDGAASSQKWGRKPHKMYRDVAGKGGATTNFEIPEWMFQQELDDMKEGYHA